MREKIVPRPGRARALVEFWSIWADFSTNPRAIPGVWRLAAGTGKLTRPLLAAGLSVIVVEPVAEMRAALPASAGALEGTAEAIPLADGSVDAVTVGQAFHWFDGDAALAEVARVLRPGGLLALIWNARVDEDPVHKAVEDLIAPYRGETPSHRGSAWREAFARTKSASSRRWSRTSAHVCSSEHGRSRAPAW